MNNNLDSMDWARLAMAIDCEGSISISKQTRKIYRMGERYLLAVAVYNTNYILADWCQFFFGPNISKIKKQQSHHKTLYVAYFGAEEAAWVLEGVLPYLLLKKEQAELGLEFQSVLRNSGRKIVTIDKHQDRIRMYLRMKELNKKGCSY